MPAKTSAVPMPISATAAGARTLPCWTKVRPIPISAKPTSDSTFMPEINGLVSIPAPPSCIPSHHLVAQLPLAAPEPIQILAQDLDDVVLVAASFAGGVRRHQHVLHRPE